MGNAARVDLLAEEMQRRIERPDSQLLAEARDLILSLREQVRERGKLLAEVFNSDAASNELLPEDLLRRIDETVLTPVRAQSSAAVAPVGAKVAPGQPGSLTS